MHKNVVKGIAQGIFIKLLQKMEPLIWNTPPIWNNYTLDRVVFHIGGFTYNFSNDTLHRIWNLYRFYISLFN